MRLKQLEIAGFKSFAKKSTFALTAPISGIVGPNGSGKSNVVEAIRFVLGEQSIKSMRGKKGEDLIFNGSKEAPRAGYARVTIVFDNRKRELNVDFDEVSITREVVRDGTNTYLINGSPVRLRDIYELLSAVNIGASSHHIISQGEADRVLNASPKERKAMLEEALGLKIFQWKIGESEKKLSKTEENIRQAESLRREIAPHIKYLKKQVEKFERAREMREELRSLYNEYLKREDLYLATQGQLLSQEKRVPEKELADIETTLSKLYKHLEDSSKTEDSANETRLGTVRNALRSVRAHKDELSRKIGRLEGLIEYKESDKERQTGSTKGAVVEAELVGSVLDDLERSLGDAEQATDIGRIKQLVETMRSTVRSLRERMGVSIVQEEAQGDQEELARLRDERKELYDLFVAKEDEERRNAEEEKAILAAIEAEREQGRESEREMYELKARRTEVLSKIHSLKAREERLDRERRDFSEELNEAVVLVGDDVRNYNSFAIKDEDVMYEPRQAQEDRRKRIERIKIRLEDIGAGSGEDVMKEYDELVERDQFLDREVTDLKESAASLTQLIKDLEEKIDTEFKSGIKKINIQFQNFFALMFGGGNAALEVVREQKRKRRVRDDEAMELLPEEVPEEAEIEEGVDVRVSLPHKKVKGLVMLSGGERALTSIALLFSISQVNPPPFLVLDETEAALDEANSRKYGDMLENLSKYSQLIVVTHNRETMSRAGVLYGVTMGSDAVSRVLSVKFEEANTFAK